MIYITIQTTEQEYFFGAENYEEAITKLGISLTTKEENEKIKIIRFDYKDK